MLYFCLFLLLLQLQRLRDVASEVTNVCQKFCAYWQSFTWAVFSSKISLQTSLFTYHIKSFASCMEY